MKIIPRKWLRFGPEFIENRVLPVPERGFDLVQTYQVGLNGAVDFSWFFGRLLDILQNNHLTENAPKPFDIEVWQQRVQSKAPGLVIGGSLQLLEAVLHAKVYPAVGEILYSNRSAFYAWYLIRAGLVAGLTDYNWNMLKEDAVTR